MRSATRLTLVLCIVAALFAPLFAESSPEALRWVNGLKSIERGSFSLEYSADMRMSQLGQASEMKMTGRLTQADESHMRALITMRMQLASGDETIPMVMEMLMVGDGETMWIEMDNPLLGTPQVMKMGLDMLDKLPQGGANASDQLDPFAKVEELAGVFDFAIGDEDAQTVTLNAEITAEALEKLAAESSVAAALDPSMIRSLAIVVDKKTGFPREFSIGGEQPMLTMRFSNYKKLDEIDPATFHYTAPEGVVVTDMSTMFGGR